MKFFKQISLLFLLTTAFAFVGCNDDDADTAGPTIEITNVTDNKEFKFGSELKMDIHFNDPSGVVEYQVEIYKEDFTPNSFEFTKLVKIAAYSTDFTVYQGVLIPEKIEVDKLYDEGNHIIKIIAVDYKGNISTYFKPIRIVYPAAE